MWKQELTSCGHFILTLMVWANRLEMRALIRGGRGRAVTWLSPPISCEWMRRRHISCNDATLRDTQAMCTWQPVAMNSRLSLWPHVSAVTGDCKAKLSHENKEKPEIDFSQFIELYASFLVNQIDRASASCIAILQEIFNVSNALKVLRIDLAYIYANISFPSCSIIKLENHQQLARRNKKSIQLQKNRTRLSAWKLRQ